MHGCSCRFEGSVAVSSSAVVFNDSACQTILSRFDNNAKTSMHLRMRGATDVGEFAIAIACCKYGQGSKERDEKGKIVPTAALYEPDDTRRDEKEN